MIKKLVNHPLAVIFFTVFVDLLGFGILIPVIPQLLANPHSQYFLLPNGWSVAQGYILLGFLTAIFPFMQFLATPILGQLSDRYGRKKLLAISLFGTCLSYIIFAYGIITKNILVLFLARGFDGITGGNIAVAQAAIADVTTPQTRAKNFGLVGAAFGLGFIIGPYLGGKLSDPAVVSWFNAATPFWFAAIISFLNVLSVIFFFPETLKHRVAEIHIKWTQSVKNIIRAFNAKHLRPLFVTTFLFQAGLGFFITFFSVFLIHKFGFSQGNIGDFFSYAGLWIVITQLLITRKVSVRFSEAQVLRVSLIAMSMGVLLFFFPKVWWQLLIVVPFFGIPNGLNQANIPGLISRSAGVTIQGEVLGINSSLQALAQTIPPVIAGYIAANLNPEDPILVSSIVIFFAWLTFMLFYKPYIAGKNEIFGKGGEVIYG